MPLVSASSPGSQTKGIQHATRRLELIADPLTFAAARDASREAQRAAFRKQYATERARRALGNAGSRNAKSTIRFQ
jgi:hypothetical protein